MRKKSYVIGIGSGGGLFGGAFFWFLLIIIVFTVQGILIGALGGFTVGIFFGAINGSLKGGPLSIFVSIINLNKYDNTGQVILKSGLKGTVEGAIVGGIVGFVQGLIISIGFVGKR